MPSLERLSKMVDGKRFAVIGLSVDEDPHLVREFLTQNGITFPIFRDPGLKIVKQTLGVKAYPETFIVAPDGKLIRRVMGAQAWASPGMLQVLEAAYKGKRVKAGTWAYGSG
jgi:peroxiredoxin